tara:strand:+ start:280 stop:846 length:567 start_codon:yes stop_codon:yes gene_type:complete
MDLKESLIMNNKKQLSKPIKRLESHLRKINCAGYKRIDELLDIEGELIDTKEYDFPLSNGQTKKKGTPIHHMQVRITINNNLEILDAEAITIVGPYKICPLGANNIKGIIGLVIGPGWRNSVKKSIGGRKGCTHITELLGPIATTAFQTLYGENSKSHRQNSKSSIEEEITSRAKKLVNTCIAYSEND